VEGTGPCLKVREGAVTRLSIGLDKAVDVEPIDVVKERTIFQRAGQGPMVGEVSVDGKHEGRKLSEIREAE